MPGSASRPGPASRLHSSARFWLLLHLKSDSPWLRDVESFEGHEQPVSLALSCRRGTPHAMFQLVGGVFSCGAASQCS